MINPGDTLVNSVTGEELTFLQTAESTGGEYVEVVAVVQPGGAVAAAHVHPKQSETFTAIEGVLDLRVGKQRIRLVSRRERRRSRPVPPTSSGTTATSRSCSTARSARPCSSSR